MNKVQVAVFSSASTLAMVWVVKKVKDRKKYKLIVEVTDGIKTVMESKSWDDWSFDEKMNFLFASLEELFNLK